MSELGPPIPTEEHVNEFLQTFARAILAWGYVEMNLYLIFQTLMVSRRKEAVSAAYHSVINLKARLDMVNATAEIMISGSMLDEWKSLARKVSNNSGKRNALAHLLLQGHFNGAKDITLRSNPSIFDVRKAKLKDYDLNQIAEFHDSFRKLASDLDDFWTKLHTHLSKEFP
jgi:hypothetical protein